MNLIIAIPIFRNRFQKSAAFFSVQTFSVGSLIFVPFSEKEKPAIVIQIEDLKKNKFFLRKNKIKIRGINNPAEFPMLERKMVEIILIWTQKINLPLDEILQKIFPKKIIREINQITPSKKNSLKNIQKFSKELTAIFIEKKLDKFLIKKTPLQQPDKKTSEKINRIKNIGDILLQTKTKKTSLHSEKHYLVDEIRNYFGESAQKGVGSFSFYLGFFKKIPRATIYQYWAEVKESRQPITKQQKIFWWKIGQYLKTKR